MKNAEGFRALMQRLANGSDEAAQEIVDRYGPHLLKVIRKRLHPALRPIVDSTDFLQSVWGSLVRMGPGMERIRDPEHLLGMLTAIARNKVIDELRQRTGSDRSVLPTHCSEEELERAQKLHDMPRPPTASQIAIARERWEQILENQPETCQQLLAMRMSGYSYDEIGRELGMNERTARRIVARLIQEETTSGPV